MQARLIERDALRLVHVTATGTPIRSRQDALEVMLGHGHADIAGVAVDEACLHPDFFRLKTGIAGDILQAFATYRTKLAVVGDFTRHEQASGSLRAFIVESNRGRQAFFVAGIEQAIGCFARAW